MKNCCICFSLRTGGIIIGVIDLIGAILGAIGSAIFLGIFAIATKVTLNEAEQKAAKQRESFWDAPSSTTEFAVTTLPSETDERNDKDQYLHALLAPMLTCLFYVLMILCIVQIVVASFLLYGIRKKSTSSLKVWLIFKIVFLLVSISSFIVMTCAWGITVKDIVQQILAVALNVYFIKAISDLRKEIREELAGNAHISYSAKA